jgi:TM2 domain-containing membrane protein YozV
MIELLHLVQGIGAIIVILTFWLWIPAVAVLIDIITDWFKR